MNNEYIILCFGILYSGQKKHYTYTATLYVGTYPHFNPIFSFCKLKLIPIYISYSLNFSMVSSKRFQAIQAISTRHKSLTKY